MTGIRVERLAGGAAELHRREPGPIGTATVWWCEVDRPAVVLGSRQAPDLLDLERCRREGIEVVRRRSGGGVVLLLPGEVVWLDVLLPPDVALDGHRADDVRAVMIGVGECWAAALGASPDLTVHRGAMCTSPWSDLVCFAGIGPGEVLDRGHKLVGLSQRRGRWGARVQGAVHRRVDLVATAGLLSVEHPPVGSLPEVAARPDLDAEALVDALVERLAASLVMA